jgi:hypothetical protein
MDRISTILFSLESRLSTRCAVHPTALLYTSNMSVNYLPKNVNVKSLIEKRSIVIVLSSAGTLNLGKQFESTDTIRTVIQSAQMCS